MAYATVGDWAARFGELDESLDPVVVTDGLEQASRRVDEVIGRRPLEPKTVTNELWQHVANRPDDRVFLPDYPPLYPERWFCALTALKLYDASAELQQTVTVGDCTVWAERLGRVFLPSGVSVYPHWWIEASYQCGYGTSLTVPNIPETLTDATLRIVEANIGSVLTVGRRVDRPVWFVNQDVIDLLAPWRFVVAA